LNFEQFVASKILGYKRYKNSISSPIIKISILSVIIGIVLMNISMSIGFGIQKNIKEKFSSNTGDLIITNYNNNLFETLASIETDLIDFSNLQKPNILSLKKVSYNPSIYPKDNTFEYLIFKGVESIVDHKPKSSVNKLEINEVSISKFFSDRSGIGVGQSINLLFFTKENTRTPKIRKFIVKSIYETGINEYDSKIIIGNFTQSRLINGWNKNETGGVEISLNNSDFDSVYESVPPTFKVMLNRERFGELFNWISLFDSNVYLIIFLMIVVGGINMVTSLLITILEKRKFIGILKVLGTNNYSIRKIFLINGVFLLIRGLIIGNIISYTLLYIQLKFNIIKLDQTVYYVNSVPVDLNFMNLLILNVVVILTSFLMLILPSSVVTKLNATKILRSS